MQSSFSLGKQEILSGLEDGTLDSPFCSSSGAAYKTTTILIGKPNH